MDLMKIDDFAKFDLRVATVLYAESHPNADKLLVLKIQLEGGEERQIVAGVKKHFTPEQITGMQIIVVTNLEPATIRGVLSNGMMLAASDADGNLAALVPHKPIAVGSKVK